jgi:hypothetical protein
MKNLFISLFISFVPLLGFSQVMEKSITFENLEGAKKSTQELTDLALRQMAEDLVIEFIGLESFSKNKAVLLNRVVSQANKFTPFQKVNSIERGEFGARINVDFKISLVDFRKLLTEAGVYAKVRLANDVIAFFSLEDENGEKIAQSWLNTKGSDSVSLQMWSDEFKLAFEKAGYSFNKNINPQWLQIFKPQSTVLDVMNKNTNTKSLVLWGVGQLKKDLRTQEPVLIVQVKVYSQELRREVTDSVRKLNIKDQWQQKWSTWAQELILQIDEVDSKSLAQGSSLIMSFRGPVSLIEQESVKSWILASSPTIKSVTERKVAQDLLTFEVDATISASEIAQKFSQLNFKGKKLKVSHSGSLISLEIIK